MNLQQSRIVWQGKWRLRVDSFRLADGRLYERGVIEHPGAVVVVPLLPGDDGPRVLVLRQYRPALERTILELPAGTREGDEPWLECAQRELREDVVQAARDGRFHVWAVSHINEGLELLTGRPAGAPDADGDYPEGTVHYAVKKRLLELATEFKSFGEDHNEEQA